MTTPQERFQQIRELWHTFDDIHNIANQRGIVKLYHGAPTMFAELLVKKGPCIPYRVEDTARYVAKVYGLTWYEFRPYAYRAHEVVERLSTAPASIAVRWAWSFPKGEILTDLNSHARLVFAAKPISKQRRISLDDAVEELYEQAWAIGRQRGIRVTFDSAPDVLGIEDRIPVEPRTGSLVELEVSGRAIHRRVALDAQYRIRDVKSGEVSKELAVIFWNNTYIDIKVAPRNIRKARIVIRDMESWEEEPVEDEIRRYIAQY